MAKKFSPGENVFAKVRGYPPWPAKVVGLADATVNKVKYHVSFYGTGETAICKVEDLFGYLQYKDKYGKPLKRKGFNEALAEVEAIAGLLPSNVKARATTPVPAPAASDDDKAVPAAGGEGEGDEADSDKEFALVIDESPQRTTPAGKQSRSASTEEKKKTTTAKRKRESEGTEQEKDSKRSKRGSIQSARKSTTDSAEGTKSAETTTARPSTPGAAATPQSPSKAEVISRSGRKIKPKKFLDEDENESGSLPETNGSPKGTAAVTPKPVDGEVKQGGTRSSRRLSTSKGSAATPQTDENATPAQDGEPTEEQEAIVSSTGRSSEQNRTTETEGSAGSEADGDQSKQTPYQGFILTAKTLTGHLVEIKIDQDRPKSFKNEKAMHQWDQAVFRNALKLKDQIETGKYIPDDIKKELDRKVQLKEEEKSILKRDKIMERKKNKLRWLKLESRLVELDALVKSRLSLQKAEPEKCMAHLDEIASLNIDPLMLKKHPQVVETVKKLRRYIGNTTEWNLDDDAKTRFTNQASQIREKADHIYNKFKTLFTVPEGRTFWQVFADHVTLFKQQTSHLSQDKLYSLTVDPGKRA